MANTNNLIIPLLLLGFVHLLWSRSFVQQQRQQMQLQGQGQVQPRQIPQGPAPAPAPAPDIRKNNYPDNYDYGNQGNRNYNNDYYPDNNNYPNPPAKQTSKYQGNQNYPDNYDYGNQGNQNYNYDYKTKDYQNYGSKPQSIIQSMLQHHAEKVNIEKTPGFNGVNDYQPPGVMIDIQNTYQSNRKEERLPAPSIWTEGVGPALMNGCFQGEYSITDPCSRFKRKARRCWGMLDAANFIGVGFDGRGFYSLDSRKMSLIQRTCEKNLRFQRHTIPDNMAAYGLWDYSVSTDTYADAKHYVKYLQEKSGSMETESMFQAETKGLSEGSSMGFKTDGLVALAGLGIGAASGSPQAAMKGLEIGNALKDSIGFGISQGSQSGKQSGNTNQDSSSAQRSSMASSMSDSSATNMLAVMEADVKLYELSLGEMRPDDLSAEFYSCLMELPSSYFDLGADVKYQDFILRWGTHYVHAAKFGGRISVIKKSKKESKLNQEEFAEYAQDEFSAMLGTMRSSMEQKSSGFKVMGFGTKKTKTKSKSSQTEERKGGGNSSSSGGNSKSSENSEFIQTSLKVVGGNPAIAASISSMFSPKFAMDFKLWINSIRDYVRPIDFSLEKLSSLSSLNIEYLFASSISKEGCFGNTKLDQDKHMYYFERTITKHYYYNYKKYNFTETIRNYCKYKTEKKKLIKDLKRKQLAIERAESIYMMEGPFSTSSFDIDGGTPGCEFNNLEYLYLGKAERMRSWPNFKDMKQQVFRAIFEMPQDLHYVKRNSEFLVMFYDNRWYTKSPQPGAKFNLALSCPFKKDAEKMQDDQSQTKIMMHYVCIAQLPLEYSEDDGLLKLDVSLYMKYNITLPVWLGIGEPLGYVQILEPNLGDKVTRGNVGLVPCNIKWYNSHQITVKTGSDNEKCLYFQAASSGGIHIVFAGLPENKKTWISLRLSSGSVSFYKAMVLEQFDDGNVLSGTTGSATLFEAYFICLVKRTEDSMTLNFGKSLENSEHGHYYSTHVFKEVENFEKYFYAFGSGDKTISISDLRVARGHLDNRIVCRNGLTKNANGICEMVCHPQCDDCFHPNSPIDCKGCKNFKITTGKNTFHCAESCPTGFESREPIVTGPRRIGKKNKGECICRPGYGISKDKLLKEKLSIFDYRCEQCPAGTISKGNLCEECPANTYSKAGKAKCSPCWNGHTSGPGSDACEEEVMQLIPPGLMKASSGEANLAFATTSSEPWRPRADDTKFEIYYQFPTEVKIGKFAFSAGKDDAKISFTVIGKDNCDNPKENWEPIMDVGSTMMKALSLNFWYVPKDSRKNLRCVGLKFKNKEVAVTNLRMWEKSDGTLVAMRIKEKGCWSYNGYDGFANTTKSGKSCRPWADHPPVRIKNKNQGKPFPYDYSINHLNNYCRKWSMNTLSAPMCVPISQDADGPINIETCDVPQCHDEIKLEGGKCEEDRCEGRVMIKYNELFGYVCNRDWDQRDGDVVCKYFKMKATNYENKWKLTSDQAAHGIHINGLKCRGDEDNLAVCKHSGYGNTNCGYADIVGVTCHKEI